MCRLDELRVLYGTSRQLGERLAEGRDALRLHLEATLLRHGCIPANERLSHNRVTDDVRYSHVIRREKGAEENNVGGSREAVLRRIMGSHVNHGVDV